MQHFLVCPLPASFSTHEAQVCVRVSWTSHSCGPDVRVYLPFVWNNFLPSCQRKRLQRRRPVWNVANMCCSAVPSGEGLQLASHYTPAGINPPTPPRAVLCVLYFPASPLLCYFDSSSTDDGRRSAALLSHICGRQNKKSIPGQTVTGILWPFSPLCSPVAELS